MSARHSRLIILGSGLRVIVQLSMQHVQILNQHLLQVYSLAANLQQQPKLTTGRAILKV